MDTTYSTMDDIQKPSEEELESLYSWVDQVPLSRPKRNINRDFSDGVMVAELIAHFLPSYVQMHNYTSVSATKQKLINWDHLNRKVFKKLHFTLTEDLIREICVGKPGVVERFLMHLRMKIEREIRDRDKDAELRAEMARHQQKSNARLTGKQGKGHVNDQPEADQNIDSSNYPEKMPNIHSKHPSKPVIASPGRKPLAQQPFKGIKSHDETVPRAVYEEKEQENLAKEETIQILQAKVRRLEHLLHLKDVRIEDLQNRLESTRPTGLARR